MPGDQVLARRVGTTVDEHAVIIASRLARADVSGQICVVYEARHIAAGAVYSCFAGRSYDVKLLSRNRRAHSIYDGTEEHLPIRLGYNVKFRSRRLGATYIVTGIHLLGATEADEASTLLDCKLSGRDIGISIAEATCGRRTAVLWWQEDLATLPSLHLTAGKRDIPQVVPACVDLATLLVNDTLSPAGGHFVAPDDMW